MQLLAANVFFPNEIDSLPAATAMQLLAANVMNPNEIDVSLDEISGLDEIVQDLVGRL